MFLIKFTNWCSIWIVLFSKLGEISFFDDNDISFTDEEIVEKIKWWEKNLFEVLLDRYKDKIFRYCYYQFNFSKEIAEDLVEDIFLKVWNNLWKFRWWKFNSWIYSIAHNLIIDFLRKKKLNLTDVNLEEFSLLDLNNLPENEYKKKILFNLLNKLDYKYKEVLILYYFEEKSYEEIAVILGTQKNTVGSWIKRAKDSLYKIIQKDKILKEALVLDL